MHPHRIHRRDLLTLLGVVVASPLAARAAAGAAAGRNASTRVPQSS
jgi:hypothetical protein